MERGQNCVDLKEKYEGAQRKKKGNSYASEKMLTFVRFLA